jgi:hypothetical protein
VLEGLESTALPPIGGYVVGVVKPTGTPILVSHLNDPVLSGGRAGLGRVAVFTGDLGGSWGAPLRDWRGASRLWTQTVRWLSRRDDNRELRIAVTDRRDGTHLEVESEPTDRDVESVRATVHASDGADRDVVLNAVAPGRYDVRLPGLTPGAAVIAISARDPQGDERRVIRTIYRSADREHASIGVNRALLARLAAMTGGRVLADEKNPFASGRTRGHSDAAPAALVTALVMFVIDLAVGRGVRGPARPSRAQSAHRRGDTWVDT